MKRVKLIVFAACVICGLPNYGQGKVDFSKLSSPIIFHGGHKYAYRDPAVVFHEGEVGDEFRVVGVEIGGDFFLDEGRERLGDVLTDAAWRATAPRAKAVRMTRTRRASRTASIAVPSRNRISPHTVRPVSRVRMSHPCVLRPMPSG